MPIALVSHWISTPFRSQKCPSLDNEFYDFLISDAITTKVMASEVGEAPNAPFQEHREKSYFSYSLKESAGRPG